MSDAVVQVCGVGTARPGPPIDNATLAESLGMGSSFEKWVDTFIGTRTRHLAVDLTTAEVRYSLGDLGESAARQALTAAGTEASGIDVLIMSTSMPESLLPTTVNLVADRLGMNDVPTFQLQSGCTGAVQALDLADTMLRAGRHRTALVIGGDVCAKHVDLSVDFAGLPPSEWVNTVLFGDGVGAVVLRAAPRAAGAVVLNTVLTRFVGRNLAPGQVVEWFGLGDRHSDLTAVHEDYKAIEERVPAMAAEILEELLTREGWSRDALEYVLPPQLSPRMTARIMEGLKVAGATEISCVAETGNTANALPFFQLQELLPRMAGGDRAIAVAVESSKWIKAGFTLEKV